MPASPKMAPAAKRTRPARQCGMIPISAVMVTSTSDVVVAAFGSCPAAYTSAGTARIDPPPPSAPSETPIRNPNGDANNPRTAPYTPRGINSPRNSPPGARWARTLMRISGLGRGWVGCNRSFVNGR